MRYEHVSAESDYPLGMWDDELFRERLWAELRDKAAATATARGHLFDHGHREHRTVTRLHGGGSVRLRLEGWAQVPENTK